MFPASRASTTSAATAAWCGSGPASPTTKWFDRLWSSTRLCRWPRPVGRSGHRSCVTAPPWPAIWSPPALPTTPSPRCWLSMQSSNCSASAVSEWSDWPTSTSGCARVCWRRTRCSRRSPFRSDRLRGGEFSPSWDCDALKPSRWSISLAWLTSSTIGFGRPGSWSAALARSSCQPMKPPRPSSAIP